MHASHASVPTPSASRYLQQLCNHWSHKFAVEYTPSNGTIAFAADRKCVLEATPELLSMRIEAADEATLVPMEGVVVEHLKRFAFREELGAMPWTARSH